LTQLSKQGRRDSHVIEISDLALLVGNDGELDERTGDILDVLDPALVAVEGVGRKADQLDAALGELGGQAGHLAELGRADGSVVLGVREEDDPAVTNELVEVNRPLGGLGLEVWGDRAQAEAGRQLVLDHRRYEWQQARSSRR